MSGGPHLPEPEPMGDEAARVWAHYDELLRRCLTLEGIAERLAATSADPVAVEEFLAWRASGTSPPQ